MTTTIGAAGAAVATGATEVVIFEEVALTVVTTGGALTEVATGGTLPTMTV